MARHGLITAAAASPTAAFRIALRVATCRPSPPRFTLSAAQLLVNQRIAQAALRRIDALAAALDGAAPPPTGRGATARRVTLSLRQLRINHRVAMAALRRGDDLTRRLDGLPPRRRAPGASGPGRLSVRDLQVVQVIAQAAVRRANSLAERIPELPRRLPGPLSHRLDELVGTLAEPGRLVMRVGTVRRRGTLGDGAPVEAGDRVPVVVLGARRPSFGAGAPIGAVGVLHGGVMYGAHVSIGEPPARR